MPKVPSRKELLRWLIAQEKAAKRWHLHAASRYPEGERIAREAHDPTIQKYEAMLASLTK